MKFSDDSHLQQLSASFQKKYQCYIKLFSNFHHCLFLLKPIITFDKSAKRKHLTRIILLLLQYLFQTCMIGYIF